MGTPLAKASNETVVGRNGEDGDFRQINRYISEMVQNGHIVTTEDYRKSHGLTAIGLLPISITLNDLERP